MLLIMPMIMYGKYDFIKVMLYFDAVGIVVASLKNEFPYKRALQKPKQ